MRTPDQAGAAERTAAAPAELFSGPGRTGTPSTNTAAIGAGQPDPALPAKFAAKRRGPFRRFFIKHPRITDILVVVCYLLLSLTSFRGPSEGGHAVRLALIVAIGALLMFRRYRPLAVVIALTLLETTLLVLAPFSNNAGVSLWFGLYAVSLAYRARTSFTIAVSTSVPLMVVLMLFYRVPQGLLEPGAPSAQVLGVVSAVVVLLSNVVSTGIGVNIRRNRQHDQELRAWAERNAQLAQLAERNRIAREMHDVVAHSLTVMVALSDGAAVVVKKSPERAAEVLAELSQTGRTAIADMRRVLGVLRQDGPNDDGVRAPLPDSAGIAGLLEGFRHAGLPLQVTHMGPPLPRDPALQLTVYRILQESLTNVLRYGRAVSRVQVVITHQQQDSVLRIKIMDDGRGTMDPAAAAPGGTPSLGTGKGIVGMQERAGIYAGTVTAGPGPHGGWVVEAVLQANAGHS